LSSLPTLRSQHRFGRADPWTRLERSTDCAAPSPLLRARDHMSTRRSHVALTLVVDSQRQSTDAELARALASGALWAITETWQRFAPMVLKLAERTLGSRSEAQDIAQDVFFHVCRKAAALREPEKLRSFVYSFAIRTLKSELRRRKVRAWLSFHNPDALADLSFGSLDVEGRDALRRFYALLDRLSARDRLAFSLRYLEAMTIDEIASAMQLSSSTVKRALSNASSRLSGWVRADPTFSHLLRDRGFEP
jgi:RNA polymerase sigma-70 factor, ECF subfamily